MTAISQELPDDPQGGLPGNEKITIFRFFLVILSLYVLVSLFIQSMFDLSPEMDRLMDHIDTFVCCIFLVDFFVRLHQAPSKKAFLKWGWIDFVSSIPMLQQFRAGSLLRIIRFVRVLRAVRSIRVIWLYLFGNRGKNTFITVAAVSCLLMMGGSIIIFNVEKDQSQGNIKTPSDAIWWSIVTITTVGYGDRFPVSDTGRAVAAVLMTAGVGLFGTFTGFIASMFVEPDIKREESEIHQLVDEIKGLKFKMESMESKMRARERQNRRLVRRIRVKKPPSAGAGDPARPAEGDCPEER